MMGFVVYLSELLRSCRYCRGFYGSCSDLVVTVVSFMVHSRTVLRCCRHFRGRCGSYSDLVVIVVDVMTDNLVR